MKKEETIQALRLMATEMQPFVVEANVPEGQLVFSEDAEQLKVSYFNKGFTWLRRVYCSEFDELKKAKALQPQEIWDRYKLMGWTDHAETKILKKALFQFRKAIIAKNRPTIFKKGEVKKCLKSSKLRKSASR